MSPPSTPNFSRPLPSPYSNMGTPSRQTRATSRERVPSRPGVLPRTSPAPQLESEKWPPRSASLALPSGINTAQESHLRRRMSGTQDLTSRFPMSPGTASARDAIMDRKIERKVSMNDFLKEQWDPETSTLSYNPEHLPVSRSKSSKALRREANLSIHERRASEDSEASDQSDDTVLQTRVNCSVSNTSVSPAEVTIEKLRKTPGDIAGADQNIVKDSDILQTNNGRMIENFRHSLWKHLDLSREKLVINVFWPKKLEDLQDEDYDEEADMLPYDSMKPLLKFRNLRNLTLGGMERSYQRIIWQTVFQNPQLENLTLEMALEAVIIHEALPKCIKITKDYIFPIPIPGWASVAYLGHNGQGVLREEYGDGEYLDEQAMKLAHEDAFGVDAKEIHMMGISKLVLMGFVMDASPFFRWFDAGKLRTIVLKDNCWDAGFVLPPAMRGKTQVLLGGGLVPKQVFRGRAFGPGEAKIVTLRKGKVVDEEPVELVQEPQQGGQLKKKLSGISRKLQTKEQNEEGA